MDVIKLTKAESAAQRSDMLADCLSIAGCAINRLVIQTIRRGYFWFFGFPMPAAEGICMI